MASTTADTAQVPSKSWNWGVYLIQSQGDPSVTLAKIQTSQVTISRDADGINTVSFVIHKTSLGYGTLAPTRITVSLKGEGGRLWAGQFDLTVGCGDTNVGDGQIWRLRKDIFDAVTGAGWAGQGDADNWSLC